MTQVGPMLRQWRQRRHRSQLDIATEAGVSARHLSFIETGRSRPSPELLLHLASHLEIPLRERNDLLLAAGYAPHYTTTDWDAPAMTPIRNALLRLLDAHAPYPGVVIDRCWNIKLANLPAQQLLEFVTATALGPEPNVFRLCLHPEGLAPLTQNFEPWAQYLLGELRRAVHSSADPALEQLEAEVLSYPTVAALPHWTLPAPELLIPCELRVGGVELNLFTTLTRFSTPADVTLDEILVELFYPADQATEARLRRSAQSVCDA